VLVEDRIGVSEPVTRLGSINGAAFVDGAAQHCASTPRRPGVRRIMLPSPSRFGTDRRSSKAPPGLTLREATDLTSKISTSKNTKGGLPTGH
jgi:hypothetical protein